MKIKLNPVKKLRASAMIVVCIFAVLVSSTLAAYLLMVQNEYTQVGRSQTWNGSMVLAEAGMEEGMALINMNVTNFGQNSFTLITNWISSATANGWTDVYGNKSVFTMTRTNVDGKGGSYRVWVTNAMTISGGVNVGTTNPIVVSVGVANWILGVASAHGPMFAQSTLVANSQSQVTREVYVQTYYNPLFSGAMTALTNISLGSGTLIDSFDSMDPTYSDWNTNWGYGTYNPNKRKDNGNVSSDSDVNAAVSTGQNGQIYGHVNTGPGGGINLGNNASVGSLAYVSAGTQGIQAGFLNDDMNTTFNDVSLPLQFPTTATSPTVITNSGNYQINNLGSLNIQAINSTPVNVTIYLPNGINYTGHDALNVGVNCNVTIYLGGDVNLGGNGSINNATQNALSLSIYALPSVGLIDLQGNGAFTGTIYAPEANVKFGGGGSSSYDIVGSIDSNGVSFNGHPNFHYDENLARRGPGRGFVPSAWKEVVVH